MHAKVGATPAFVLSQLTTAVVGAVCTVAAAVSIASFVDSAKTALFQPVLSISSEQVSLISKIGNMKFRFNQDSLLPSLHEGTPNIDALVVTNVDEGLRKISSLEVHARKERRSSFSRIARLARCQEQRQRALGLAQADRVALTQSAPVPMVAAVSPAAPPVVSEQEKLRQVHLALMAQFKVAMNSLPTHSPSSVVTQVARSVNTQPAAGSDLGLDGVPELPRPPKKPTHHAVVAAHLKQDENTHAKLPPVVIKTKESTDHVLLTASAEQPNVSVANSISKAPDPQETARIAALEKLADKLAGTEETPAPVEEKSLRQVEVSTNPLPQSLATQGASEVSAAETAQAITFTGSNPTTLTSEYSATPSKAQPGYSHPIVVAMNTHPQPPAVVPAPPHTSRDTMTDADDFAAAPATQSKASSKVVSFVEALDGERPVKDAQAEILTREDPSETYGQAQVGWRMAKAVDHWPTVYWNHGGEIPVLSKNSAKMLSIKAGVSLQSEAGIVIAKAPAGWSLEFSGRSEHALVFNLANQLLANDAVDEERYYVFLNASPGAQILLPREEWGNGCRDYPRLRWDPQLCGSQSAGEKRNHGQDPRYQWKDTFEAPQE